MDKDVLVQVIHCESSSDVWSVLENLYSQQTVAKSFQLKQQLRSMKKNDLSVNDYILKLKSIGHVLATIGEPLNDRELLMAILYGLDSDFETVVSLITYQMDDIDIDKVQYLLLIHEQRLAVKNASSVSSIYNVGSANVNLTSQWTKDNSGMPRGGGGSRGGSYRGGNYRGRGRGRSFGCRMYCQLCGRSGHLVDCCYHRFNQNF